jgi:hypothetical protein
MMVGTAHPTLRIMALHTRPASGENGKTGQRTGAMLVRQSLITRRIVVMAADWFDESYCEGVAANIGGSRQLGINQWYSFERVVRAGNLARHCY